MVGFNSGVLQVWTSSGQVLPGVTLGQPSNEAASDSFIGSAVALLACCDGVGDDDGLRRCFVARPGYG